MCMHSHAYIYFSSTCILHVYVPRIWQAFLCWFRERFSRKTAYTSVLHWYSKAMTIVNRPQRTFWSRHGELTKDFGPQLSCIDQERVWPKWAPTLAQYTYVVVPVYSGVRALVVKTEDEWLSDSTLAAYCGKSDQSNSAAFGLRYFLGKR